MISVYVHSDKGLQKHTLSQRQGKVQGRTTAIQN